LLVLEALHGMKGKNFSACCDILEQHTLQFVLIKCIWFLYRRY